MAVMATPAAPPRHRGTVWPTGEPRGVAVLEQVGLPIGSPWIYAVVALSVLLDVFLPVLPSGVLVITAATAAAAGTATDVPDILALTLCAATASVLGTWSPTASPGAAAPAWTGRSPAPGG